jgi:hypothetical protein
MRTARTIGLLLLGCVIAAVAAAAAVIGWLGRGAGAVVVAVTAIAVWRAYRLFVEQRLATWGATPTEVAATMPGDELVPGGVGSTRAISIDAPAAAVWPWLVQLGFGRAGWYSYDWIDNDGRPSAERIVPELQHLAVGDVIAMTPDQGFAVVALDPGRSIVSRSEDGTTSWCLLLAPCGPGSTRLVSRFRARFEPSFGAVVWAAISGPGSWIMEQRMLRNLKRLAERPVTAV